MDSGHLCVEGYNEVVMLRPSLSDDETKSLFSILNGGRYDEEPHERGGSFEWPTFDKIKQLQKEG